MDKSLYNEFYERLLDYRKNRTEPVQATMTEISLLWEHVEKIEKALKESK